MRRPPRHPDIRQRLAGLAKQVTRLRALGCNGASRRSAVRERDGDHGPAARPWVRVGRPNPRSGQGVRGFGEPPRLARLGFGGDDGPVAGGPRVGRQAHRGNERPGAGPAPTPGPTPRVRAHHRRPPGRATRGTLVVGTSRSVPPERLGLASRVEGQASPGRATPAGAPPHPPLTRTPRDTPVLRARGRALLSPVVDESGCRPGSVPRRRCRRRGDGHPSRVAVADHLLRPTRVLGRAALERTLSGLAPGGVYRADLVTQVAGGLLHHRFTLAPAARAAGAVCSLWHCPAGHPGWLLPTTLPCGARTFLGGGCPPTRPSARLVRRQCRGRGHS